MNAEAMTREVRLRLRRDHRAVLERIDELEATLARSARNGADAQVARALRRFVDFLDRALPPHFELEERTFPPVAAGDLDEHADLRERLATLRCGISPAAAREIGTRLRQHIASEERLLRGVG